jgi:hypothetical protein
MQRNPRALAAQHLLQPRPAPCSSLQDSLQRLATQHPSSPAPGSSKPGWWRSLALSQMPAQQQPAYRLADPEVRPVLPSNLLMMPSRQMGKTAMLEELGLLPE